MKQNEIDAILNVHRLAFGPEEGEETAQLAKDLLGHPDVLSFSVERDGQIAGNVLFMPFEFVDHPGVACQLLAPCGVLPEYQGQGVGRELMQTSIAHLTAIGTDAVFVLGVPTFYPRYGFAPTDKQTPYPDLLTLPQSWMALELVTGTVAPLSGKTLAIPQFMQPQFWDTSMYG
ncbi:N-acetyltransferase [Tropicibacter sp. R16_0]|uniref:GNAT family N-acetyltransferase n=1 Tax=Tropicibacter sp. R16_0 TaxID=2821102 RepID=UPI001ADCD000|nr:N-acetyltransferase [Tropicibacter sp. R16_0]MBO9449306.1 N-acetyltransferase [Tropicibacter sp. R16_0]